MQTITRKGSFDSMHRLLEHNGKCKYIHGHRWTYELSFAFETADKIGYAVDFTDIKRVFIGWIDRRFDHTAILNPADKVMLEACEKSGTNCWLMSINGDNTNPSVENVAKELFLGVRMLAEKHYPAFVLTKIKLFETESCWTECTDEAFTKEEKANFIVANNTTV